MIITEEPANNQIVFKFIYLGQTVDKRLKAGILITCDDLNFETGILSAKKLS